MLITAEAFTGIARMRARPLAYVHVVYRQTIDCRVRSKIPVMSTMIPAATAILARRSSSVSTTVSYTICIICPHRKKSRHVRSGDMLYETFVEIEEDLVTRITRAHSPTFTSLHLRHNAFSNTSVVSPTSQLILQPFRCFTYITAHSPILISLLLRHKLFTYVTGEPPMSERIASSRVMVIINGHQGHMT